jgi:hypothetical protein
MLISMLGTAFTAEMTSFVRLASRATTVKNLNGKRRLAGNSTSGSPSRIGPVFGIRLFHDLALRIP